jgi:hypothetical protein
VELILEQLPNSPLQPLEQLKTNTLQFVIAYYQIAASRFADNICLVTQSRLFARCAREIGDAVTHHLGTAEDTGIVLHVAVSSFNVLTIHS